MISEKFRYLGFLFLDYMKHFFSTIILVIAIVVNNITYAQTTPGNPTDDIKKISKIVMSGNSITHGGNWKKILDREDVTNWGIPGYTTEQISWTIKNYLKEKPAVVFLEGGINDISLGISPKRVFQNYVRMIDSIRAYNVIPVVQSTILKCYHEVHNKNYKADNKKVNKVNKMVAAYCKKNNIKYIDLNSVLSKNGELIAEYTSDGAHLKENAYIVWAKLVTAMLKELNI
jgi:lysophospholipase L1-like esterase